MKKTVTNIRHFSLAELEEYFEELGEKKFRSAPRNSVVRRLAQVPPLRRRILARSTTGSLGSRTIQRKAVQHF